MGKKKSILATKRSVIIHLHQSGQSIREIAAKTKVSYNALIFLSGSVYRLFLDDSTLKINKCIVRIYVHQFIFHYFYCVIIFVVCVIYHIV